MLEFGALRRESVASTPSFRFSITTLLLWTAYVGFVCAWCYWLHGDYGWRWQRFFPGWFGLLPVALLLWIGWSHRQWASGVATDAILLAGLMTGWWLCSGVISHYSVCSCESVWAYSQLLWECALMNFANTLSLPLFAALPVAFLVLKSGRPRYSPATKWLLLSCGIAGLDLLFCSFSGFFVFRIGSLVHGP